MTNAWSTNFLSSRARYSLERKVERSKVIDDGFSSTFTTFNRASHDNVGEVDENIVATMRAEIANALDKLDVVVAQVLEERKTAEKSAAMWITVGGAVVVLLVLIAAISPFFTEAGVLSSVFSSLSVGGLLMLLYSPVRERMNIANDRSNLLLMTQGFRLRFAMSNTVEQLQVLGRELTAALKVSNKENNY